MSRNTQIDAITFHIDTILSPKFDLLVNNLNVNGSNNDNSGKDISTKKSNKQ